MGGASLPLAILFGAMTTARGGEWLLVATLVTGFGVAAGALGGAPAAALEGWARTRGGWPRAALVTLGCSLLLPLALAALLAQLVYVVGVLERGVGGGLDGLARAIGPMLRQPGLAIAFSGGLLLSLVLPMIPAVWLRLRPSGLHVGWQAFLGLALVVVEAIVCLLGGFAIVILVALVDGHEVDGDSMFDDVLASSPFLGGFGMACAVGSIFLVVIGLAMAALLPGALKLADRFGAPRD